MVVERVLDHRTDAKLGPQFLVQWEGCEPKDSTWEPLLNFLTPNEIIMGYIQENEVPVDFFGLVGNPETLSCGGTKKHQNSKNSPKLPKKHIKSRKILKTARKKHQNSKIIKIKKILLYQNSFLFLWTGT